MAPSTPDAPRREKRLNLSMVEVIPFALCHVVVLGAFFTGVTWQAWALCFGLLVLRVDRADGHAQAAEEGEGPVAVALHEVVVDGDDVDVTPLDDRQGRGERGDDRLALAPFENFIERRD